jgi:drug/metabolite transporter (DMT)-like permease
MIATLLWGATFTIVRDAVAVYGVLSFLAVRFLIASVALGIIGARRMSLRTLLVGGTVGSALAAGFVLQTIGLRYTSPTNSGLITGLVVVLTPAIAFLMYCTRIPKLYIAPVVGAFVGLALLTGESPEEFRVGDILTMACAVAFAAHVVLLGRYAGEHDAVGFALAQMLSTAVLCGVAAPILEPMELPPREIWFALGMTGLGASALAFLIMTYVQQRLSAIRTAVILTMEPLFAVVFGYLLAGDRLTVIQSIGAALILSALLVGEVGPALLNGRRSRSDSPC